MNVGKTFIVEFSADVTGEFNPGRCEQDRVQTTMFILLKEGWDPEAAKAAIRKKYERKKGFVLSNIQVLSHKKPGGFPEGINKVTKRDFSRGKRRP